MSNLALVDGRYKLDLKAHHTVYKNAAGKRLPGVTTILGVLAKDALIEWAARVEREAITNKIMSSLLNHQAITLNPSDPYAYTVIRDTAADLGTITHARVHAWLNGMELSPEGLPPDLYAKSIHGLERFRAEWEKRGLTFVAGELAMVSEMHQVGGTADIIARDAGGRYHVLDLKTSNPHPKWPWPETVAQGSEYAVMYWLTSTREVHQVHGVRIGKAESDDIQWVTYTDAQRLSGEALFLGALDCYKAKRELTK